jgi:hypothetical protein
MAFIRSSFERVVSGEFKDGVGTTTSQSTKREGRDRASYVEYIQQNRVLELYFPRESREIDRVYYINANSECEFNDYSRAMCSSNQH